LCFLSFCPFHLAIVFLFLLSLFFWSLCCLFFCPFLLVIMLLVLLFPFKQHNDQKKGTEGQATQWPKRKKHHIIKPPPPKK
jgi:ABC-type bacteriocin/lantibiotic exporter with double-glycine peptidase domain